MAVSLESICVEAVFFVALAAATAFLHYARGFSPAFAGLSSHPGAGAGAAADSNGPLYNYACLLAAAAAAYAAARAAAFFSAAALPPSLKPNPAARRAALALCLPTAVALVCYVGAGYPSLTGSVVAKWIAGNWERNGERDLRWCGRLFALLFFWQAVFAGLAASVAGLAAWSGALVRAVWPGGAGSGAAVGGKKLEQTRQASGKLLGSGDSTSGRSSPVGETGAPGWEVERKGE